MPRSRLEKGRRSRLWASWLLLVVSLGALLGCGQRSCSETDAELEPLAGELEDRLRAKVSTLYYAGVEYRGRAVRVEGFACGAGGETSYQDPHWSGSAPRLLVRAANEARGETLSLAAPGWDLDELEELAGREVVVVVYVPEGFVPPPAGYPAELGRVLYLCD